MLIKKENLIMIADTIMRHIFISAKRDDNALAIETLCCACDVYRDLKGKAQTAKENSVEIAFPQELADFLRFSIAAYVIDEIRDYDEDKVDAVWLCCITDFYRQLIGSGEATNIYSNDEEEPDPVTSEDIDCYPDDEEDVYAYADKKQEENNNHEIKESNVDDEDPIDVPWLM